MDYGNPGYFIIAGILCFIMIFLTLLKLLNIHE